HGARQLGAPPGPTSIPASLPRCAWKDRTDGGSRMLDSSRHGLRQRGSRLRGNREPVAVGGPDAQRAGGERGRRAAAGAPGRGAIKPYELSRRLGAGGMGAVFLARDLRLGRLVAIKILLEHTGTTAQRFLAEARATARCRHDNIVVIHDVDEVDGYPYLVLE